MAKRTISTCDMDLKSSSKKFSNIWDNLTKIDDKKVKCNFCFKMLNLDKSGSTGNLLKHLRSHKEYEAKSAIPSTKPIFSFCTSSAKMNPTSMEAANITSSLCDPGNIITTKRAQLKCDLAEKLILMYHNRK